MDAREWDERYRGSDLVWSAGPNRFVAERTEDLPPGRALDLAAGEGRNAIWLAQRGWSVTAIDFSDVAVERGRRIARERGVDVDWRVADVTVAPLADRGYDLVLVSYLQLPREDRSAVHLRAAGAVAAGGTLLVVGHDRTNLDRGYGGPQDPAVLLDAVEVLDVLDGSGLDVVEAGRVHRTVETEEGERTAIDTLVVVRRPAS